MPPKRSLPKPASPSSPVPDKPAPARGTLQHLWANAPNPKPKPVPQVAVKIPKKFMTLEERDAADKEEAEQAQRLGGKDRQVAGGSGNGELQPGGQLDGGDDQRDRVMRNAHGEVMRNRDATSRLASASPAKKTPLTFRERMKEKENKQSKRKDLVARSDELESRSPRENSTPVRELKAAKRTMNVDGRMDTDEERSGRRSPRKSASMPVPELSQSRKIGRSKTIRQTIEVDYATDEPSSQTGRRSPRKHAGTPALRSRAGTPRSGTPVGNAKGPSQKLKRAGSNLTKDSSKTRRTISPERKVCFSTEPSTPKRNITRPNQEKTPVVEIPAFDPDANFHKALISPAKKTMKSPGNAISTSGTPSRQSQSPSIAANEAAAFQTPTKAGSRSTTPSQQSPSIAMNTTFAFKAKPAVQNGSPLKRVGKHGRSLSAAVESPGTGKRSRTGTPRTTPPKPELEDDDSFLSDLGATPSPVKKADWVKKSTLPKNLPPSKKDKSSSFLSPLEDTPSPPPSTRPKKPVHRSSFTNGKSSQSHRTVVEDTDAESSDDSNDDLPMAFHNPHNITSIPRVPSPAKPVTTNRKGVLPTPGKERKYKFSLKNLVASMEDNERTNETAAKVTKMMAEKEALSKNPSNTVSGSLTPHDGHAKLLEDVVKRTAEAGGDDAEKVLKALKRANVTQGVEMVYHFFETDKPKKIKHKKEAPDWILEREGPNKLWHEMFGDRQTREMGLRDGLFADMVGVDKGMGEGMFYWVLDQLAKERNETLRNGYLQMLLSAPISILGHFTPDTVRIHFETLGAKKEALVMDKEVVLEPVQENPYSAFSTDDQWGGLIGFLELLGRAAVLLSNETREYALTVILRLCADKLVRRHLSIQEAVQKALMLLSEAFETEEQWELVSTRLSKTLYTTIPSTSLLLHLFSSIPSRPRLHNLRRRLAYAYFLQNPSLLEEDIQSTFSIDKLTQHLETKKFMTSRDTKDSTYARLDGDIQLLDIALDSGSSSSAPKLGLKHLYYAFLAAGAAMDVDYEAGPPKLSSIEKEKEVVFNGQCDALAQRLNIILNGIQDLGPGHAERSAVRATIGAVRNRVECCVRTFVKQKVRRIGGGGGNEETAREVERREEREMVRGKKFLVEFLKKGEDGG